MTNFQDYANYYNLLYQGKNYQSEVNYVENLLKKHSVIPILEILDFGCGTGLHDNLFAKKGYKITGIDLSEKMIEIAKNKNNKSSEFIVGDVRNINLNKKFDAVISLFHVASYQTTNQDFEDYIKTAYDHLKKGGLFIFDFWYGPAVLTDKPANRIKRLENKNYKLTRISESILHENINIVDVNFEIIIEEKLIAKIEKICETHKMRYWFLPEILSVLERNNFTTICQYKWMTENNLSIESWYGVIVASK